MITANQAREISGAEANKAEENMVSEVITEAAKNGEESVMFFSLRKKTLRTLGMNGFNIHSEPGEKNFEGYRISW